MKPCSITKLISISAVVILIISALFVAGCSYKNLQNANEQITDFNGRNVPYPKNVEKIATVGSAARSVVYAGATDKLVAITEMDRPTVLRPYTLVEPELFSQLPTTSEGNHLNNTNIDKEKLLEINPDVIFSSRNKNECENLQNELGIPVIGVGFQDEIILNDLWMSLKIIGQVCNTVEIANQKIGYLKIIIEEAQKCWGITGPSVYRGAINYRGSKDLTGTYSHYCVYEAIQANNVADREDIEGAYDTSLEQILTWNPDYIFMDYENKNKVEDQINNNPNVFSQLKAFKNSNVYFVPPFNSNGTNVEYGICEMFLTAKTLYPSIYGSLNLEQAYAELFENLLGKNIYPELLNRGLTIGKASF